MRINTSFSEFKKIHSKKKHQILFRSLKCNNYNKVENLYCKMCIYLVSICICGVSMENDVVVVVVDDDDDEDEGTAFSTLVLLLLKFFFNPPPFPPFAFLSSARKSLPTTSNLLISDELPPKLCFASKKPTTIGTTKVFIAIPNSLRILNPTCFS